MKLSDLQIFLDIVQAGSLSRAATKRGTSQPNLSRALRDIEHRMSATLLNRTGRGIETTPAGEAFLEFAVTTLSNYQTLVDKTASFADGVPETLTIALPMRTEHLLLPALLRTFGRAMPNLTLQAHEAFSEDALVELAGNRVDAMVGYLAPPADMGKAIAREVFFAVGTNKYLGDEGTEISMRHALDMPLIVSGPGRYFDQLNDAAVACGASSLAPVRRCSTADAMIAFAAEGEGVAILPYSNFQRAAERGEVHFRKIVDPEIDRQIFLNFRSGLNQKAYRVLHENMISAFATVQDKTKWHAERASP